MRSFPGFVYLLLALEFVLTVPCSGDEAVLVPLFDGQTLAGWDGDARFWRVEDGTITGQSTADHPLAENTFLIWRGTEEEHQVADFELQLRVRIEGGNSGIQYRSREVKKYLIAGYQADYDASNQWTGILYEELGRGILATRGQKVELSTDRSPRVVGETTPEATILGSLRAGDWNDYRILAVGNRVQHFINGHLTVDVTDNDTAHQSLSGLLALQIHAGPPMKVQFKDIRLRRYGKEQPPTEFESHHGAASPAHTP